MAMTVGFCSSHLGSYVRILANDFTYWGPRCLAPRAFGTKSRRPGSKSAPSRRTSRSWSAAALGPPSESQRPAALGSWQALIAKANLDLGNATVNETLQKIKKICEHALNLAHSMGVIKTYNQAVQEDEDDEALEPWRPHPTAPTT